MRTRVSRPAITPAMSPMMSSRPGIVLGVLLVVIVIIALVLRGVLGQEQQGQSTAGYIVWLPGTPPSMAGMLAAQTPAAQTAQTGAALPTTMPPAQPPAVPATRELTPAQRAAVQPNELGGIPILMYHVISPTPPAVDDGYTRAAAAFKSDLQELYDRDYYVVPLSDIVQDQIRAPAGKHPVALTFDDGTAGQFRYLINADGSVTIDPESAIGIMEAFFAAHPDFGRGGYFAVPSSMCFDWQGAESEPEQTPYCAQKLTWLIEHGYEVGDHTVNHADLLNLDDQSFQAEVGGGWTGLQRIVSQLQPSILAMPFGNYPDAAAHPEQREWMRSGFTYEGVPIKLQAALMVGANPAISPASTEWDPLYVARIRAYDGELGSTEWLDTLSANPELLYTSDGDPATVTIPTVLPASLQGTIDTARLAAGGQRLILYDPVTGITGS